MRDPVGLSMKGCSIRFHLDVDRFTSHISYSTIHFWFVL